MYSITLKSTGKCKIKHLFVYTLYYVSTDYQIQYSDANYLNYFFFFWLLINTLI